MPNQNKTLLAVTSFERAIALSNCLKSLAEVGGNFEVIVIDDNSTDPAIKAASAQFGFEFILGSGGKGRHGGLYSNMQLAFDLAVKRRFSFLMVMQDDMQLVRPFNDCLEREYVAIFNADSEIASIDYRFTRSGFSGVYNSKIGAYFSPMRYTYIDVGLFHVGRLIKMNWRFDKFNHPFVASEQLMITEAIDAKLVKVTPRTPIAMHIPFPRLIRNKVTLPRLSRFFRRLYTYDTMTADEMIAMDNRHYDDEPNFRKYLRFSNVNVIDRWFLNVKRDSKIF